MGNSQGVDDILSDKTMTKINPGFQLVMVHWDAPWMIILSPLQRLDIMKSLHFLILVMWPIT